MYPPSFRYVVTLVISALWFSLGIVVSLIDSRLVGLPSCLVGLPSYLRGHMFLYSPFSQSQFPLHIG
jgi:hypothetical protein